MSQKYNYTAADFERYHSGKMSETEMHALEKAALEDPFLADALEGYSFTASPAKDIADIRERLLAKRKKKHTFLVVSKQKIWLRMAALFVLIAGIGYLAYQLNFTRENNTLAKKGNSSEIKNITEPVNRNTDTLLFDESADAAAAPNANRQESVMNQDKIQSTDLSASPEKANDKPAEYLRDVSTQRSAAPRISKDQNLAEENMLRGKIIDTRGNPVVYATVTDKAGKKMTITDSAGRFMMQAKDSSLTAVVSAVGYKTKEKKLSDKSEEVIVIEPDKSELNEVVVTARGNQKQRKELGSSSRLEGKAAGVAVNQSTAEPVTGMQKFNEYVKKNIIVPVDEEGKSYKGNVVLSFEINKKGNPKKIKVEQSFCKPCNEEAIRLLNQGPKWKYINNKRELVSIQF